MEVQASAFIQFQILKCILKIIPYARSCSHKI